jgi:hypothetical protein
MIYWVFGATAVGKKYFISAAVRSPTEFNLPVGIRPAWIENGEMTADEILRLSRKSDLLVRWQWGRQSVIKSLHGRADQEIILCEAPTEVRMSRSRDRGDGHKFTENNLAGEALEVEMLVLGLSAIHALPVTRVNTEAQW